MFINIDKTYTIIWNIDFPESSSSHHQSQDLFIVFKFYYCTYMACMAKNLY